MTMTTLKEHSTMILFEGSETGLREGIWSAYYLMEEENRERQSEMRYVALIALDKENTALFNLNADEHKHYSSKGVALPIQQKLDRLTPKEILELLSFSDSQGTPMLYHVGNLERVIWERNS
ncbi:hypothetical protein HYX13_03945 [Candidatus Woesearchaeota archaeon]|nr:hypothetical protein [Candidatus Woesearchaeota archaeon]